MNLPNYFIADLPPETRLSPAIIDSACQTLRKNRERFLAGKSVGSLVDMLSELSSNWLRHDFPFRQHVLERASETPFSRATLEKGLDDFFKMVNREQLMRLLRQEFGSAQALERFVSDPIGSGKSHRLMTPEFMVHFTAGHLPNPVWTLLIFGFLLRSAQFFKCSRGTSLLPRLFAHSLYEMEPKLGACLEIAEWPGGTVGLEQELFKDADCVTATGQDETLVEIQARLNSGVRFVGYGTRVSFGFISRDALSDFRSHEVAERAARDVVAWNQLGCLSPHLFYVEPGGKIDPEQFGQMLAAELAKKEQTEPRGNLPVEMAATISSRRAVYQMRAAHSLNTRIWTSENSTAWTVVYETDPRFQHSCLHRFVYVKPVSDLGDLLRLTDPWRKNISTIGVAVPDGKLTAVAETLSRSGATRICPLGQMQSPSLSWRHDGRSPLSELVTWVELEGSDE